MSQLRERKIPLFDWLRVLLLSGSIFFVLPIQAAISKDSSTNSVNSQDSSFASATENSDFAGSASTTRSSALQEKIIAQKKSANNLFGIALLRPTYILPFYYTGSPYQISNAPDGQKVMSEEFKGQLSFALPLAEFWQNKVAINVAYTQLSYWQVYAKSQYFRETDYEPEIFFSYNFKPNWLIDAGLDHQSNGLGGTNERSWNRAYTNLSFSGKKWLVSIKPWILIFQDSSSAVHNPDITHYLGYSQTTFSYKLFNNQVASVALRNVAESGFSRRAEEFTWSIPISKTRLRFYADFFSGYGQSLIEYNHYTNSAGIGIALNDWI